MRKALIVGINNYDKATQLIGCENDANVVKEVLGLHADERRNFTIIQPPRILPHINRFLTRRSIF